MTYYLRNAWETPDGTIIESKHGWDYQAHEDSITKEFYMCDSIGYYIRTSVNEVPAKSLCVTTDDDFEVQRVVKFWGTYGKDGKSELQYISPADMTQLHIKAVLKTQSKISPEIRKVFEQELLYRKEKRLNKLKGKQDDIYC
jgi:hypothetical protein